MFTKHQRRLLAWIRSHSIIAWMDGDAIELVVFWSGSPVGECYDVERVSTLAEARKVLGY